MAISSSDFQRQIILSQKTDRTRASVLNICSHSFLFCLLISSSLSLMLSCTVSNFHLVRIDYTAPFGRPSASFEFPHSLFTSSIKDTTPCGVLSSCGCSLSLTLTTSIGIWHSAGVTKGVTSPAAHMGIWHGAGATKSWLHSATLKKSFALIQKCLNSTEIFYPDDKRYAQWCQWNTEVRQKINPNVWNDLMPRNCWSLVILLSCSRLISLIHLQLPLKSLRFSAPLCDGSLCLFLIRDSKWKNSSTKWQSPWRVVELNRRIILSLPDYMICPSRVIICWNSWILYLLICTTLSLLHRARHDSRRRSLSMRVLYHSDTHHLNRHVVGCGCHEILIPRSFYVRFLTGFCLFRWTPYSFSFDHCVPNWERPRQNSHLFGKLKWIILLATIQSSILSICSDFLLSCLVISSSLSPEFTISLCLLHLSPFCPAHDSRRRSLFMLVLSHPDTHYLSGVYGWVRVPRNLDCSRLGDRSLLPWSKRSQLSRNFPSRWWEKRSDMTIKYEWETQKINPDEWNGMLWLPMTVSSLNLSLFLTFPLYSNVDSTRCWLVVQNWRIFLLNGNLLLSIEALHWIIILSLRADLVERSVLIISSHSWIFWLVLSSLIPLCPLVGFQPPSNSFILPHYP